MFWCENLRGKLLHYDFMGLKAEFKEQTFREEQGSQCMYSVTLRCVRAPTVAVEKQ